MSSVGRGDGQAMGWSGGLCWDGCGLGRAGDADDALLLTSNLFMCIVVNFLFPAAAFLSYHIKFLIILNPINVYKKSFLCEIWQFVILDVSGNVNFGLFWCS